MKISTKGRYGLRAIVDLSIYSLGGHVSLNSIAERQNISENYLEQVFSTLRKAGLVKSVKGAQGGYILGDKPENITIGKVLRSLEGSLSIADEDINIQIENENSIQHCISLNVWKKINEAIDNVVDSLTLEDLVNNYKQMNNNLTLMFYI